MRTCTRCGVEQEDTRFQFKHGKPVGQCRTCRTAGMKAKRLAEGISVRPVPLVTETEKQCLHCKQLKPLDRFSPASRGRAGCSAYCKDCVIQRYPRTKEQQRKATASYRKRYRPRWLSMHRLNQFKRRSLIAATCDGTVTDDVLCALYETELCCYCRQWTTEDQRTIDHRVPLSRGGTHSASNLSMACFSCNSAKSSLTDTEYLSRNTP